jgi:hypothetical protein
MFQTRENEKTDFMFNIFLIESRAVYEIMWENTAQPARSQMTILPMRIAN